MLIITIRTDKPESEIGLYEGRNKLAYLKWQAHFELAEKLHRQVSNQLKSVGKDWHELAGVVAYRGPGSFTGLRIGIAFANTLAYSLAIPIIGSSGDNWVDHGINELLKNKNDNSITPKYGGAVHISIPKK